MRRISHQRPLPERLFPAILLLATLIGAPIAINAQQFASDTNTTPPSQSPLPDSKFQPTPEDMGDSMLVQQRYQAAIEAYKKASKDSADVWNKLGVAYQMMFDLKDAERCYKKSLRLKPRQARVLNNLGSVYDSQKRYRKAERIYRKALKLDPKSAVIAMNLGTNLMVQNKFSQGSAMYERALELNQTIFDRGQGQVTETVVPREQRGAMNYYKAKGCAQAGLINRAIEYLRLALSEGFTSPGKIARDSSFARLHGNPTFERLMAEHQGQ